jgi:hypothetical protein
MVPSAIKTMLVLSVLQPESARHPPLIVQV